MNTGNPTNITSGDTTIALESSVNISPNGKTALSKLISNPLTIGATADQQIQFTTNTATNGLWPIPKTLTYSDFGTCEIETTDPNASPGFSNVITTNTVDPANPGKCLGGAGGIGLGGNYKLYRSYKPNTYDEELQVWAWNDSYATQYRDVTASGTDPQHQAWSFGGNYTTAAAMPTSGQVNYVGQWTGTAKTANFVPNTTSVAAPQLDSAGNPVGPQISISQTVAPSNDWRVSGTSALQADFGLGTLNGRLHSTNWQAFDKNNRPYNVNPDNALAYLNACNTGNAAICNVTTIAGQAGLQNAFNWRQSFMSSDVVLSGHITTNPTNAAKPNQVSNGAVGMDANNGWITDTAYSNMSAGFFGAVTAGKPKEVTGAFALKSTIADPNSGNAAINNDRRATIEMSGIFNGQ
ncbi:MAG: hypothetical protein M3O03_15135 [Pseudomonadota bacterium]|nr:hypothetical protein [Pseudomonadota bacterium]